MGEICPGLWMKFQDVEASQDGRGRRYCMDKSHSMWGNKLGDFLEKGQIGKGQIARRKGSQDFVQGNSVCVCVYVITRGIGELWASPSFFLVEKGLLGLMHPGGRCRPHKSCSHPGPNSQTPSLCGSSP